MDGIQERPVVVEDVDRFASVFNTVFGSSPENLALLANHCSVETLRNFRVVSWQFYRASLDPWRNKTTLIIDASVGLDMKSFPRSEDQQRLFEELNRVVQHRDGPQLIVEELARLVQHSGGKHHSFDPIIRPGDQLPEDPQHLFDQLAYLLRRRWAQQRLVKQLTLLVGRPQGQHHDQQGLFDELALLVQRPEGQERLVEVLAFLIPSFRTYNHVYGLDIRDFYEMMDNPETDIFNLIDHPFASYKLMLQTGGNKNRPFQMPEVPLNLMDFGRRRIHFVGWCHISPRRYMTCLYERFRNVQEIVFEGSDFQPGLAFMADEDNMSLDNVTVIKIVNPMARSMELTNDEARRRRFQSLFPNLKILMVTFDPEYKYGLFRLGSLDEFRGWRDGPGQHREHLIPYQEIEDLVSVQGAPIEQLRIDLLAHNGQSYGGNVFIDTRFSVKSLIVHHPTNFQPINASQFNIELSTLEELELKDAVFHICKFENNTSLDNVTVVKILDPKEGSVLLTNDEIRSFQRSFPNLKILTVTFKPKHQNGSCWLRSLKDFKGWRTSRGETIENIIYCREVEDFLTVQTSPIEKLRIHVAAGFEIGIRQILAASRLCVRSLILYRSRDLVPINGFPFCIELPSLEKLELWGGVTTNLNFLKWMPRLKKVVVKQNLSWEKRSLVPVLEEKDKLPYRPLTDFVENTNTLKLCLTMKHLVHLKIDDRFGKESWEALADLDVLPNLQVLKTILDNESLAVICKKWRNLKKLNLMFGSDVDDKALTGVRNTLALEGEHLELELERIPNLTDLKELTDFELLTYCERSKITDCSVIHGFLKMPSLQKLIICASSELTSKAEELLKKRMDFVKVYRNHESHEPTKAEIHCCDKTAMVFGISNS